MKKITRIMLLAGAAAASISFAACSEAAGDGDDTQIEESVQEQESGNVGDAAETSEAASEAETESEEATEEEPTQETDSPTDQPGIVPEGTETSSASNSQSQSGAGAADKTGVSDIRGYVSGDADSLGAIAYIGTVRDGEYVEDVVKNSEAAKRYPFIANIDASKVISDGGADVFVFIPKDEKAIVSVNSYGSDQGETVLYRTEKGEPIFLMTTDSIDPTMDIVVTDSAGHTARFNPNITTGNIVDMDYKSYSLFNFSEDYIADSPVDNDLLVDIIANHADGMAQSLQDGMRLSADSGDEIFVNGVECVGMNFGTEHDGTFTDERYFAITRDGTLLYEYDTASDNWVDLRIGDWRLQN